MPGSLVKRLVFIALALILIAVWIRNFFLFVPVALTDESPTPGISRHRTVNAAQSVASTSHPFSADVRDPFLRPSRTQSKPPGPRNSLHIPSSVETIRASLLGQVINSKRPYVVALDSTTGTSRLYRTGDSLNGFVLKNITRSEIIWKSSKGRRVVWKTES